MLQWGGSFVCGFTLYTLLTRHAADVMCLTFCTAQKLIRSDRTGDVFLVSKANGWAFEFEKIKKTRIRRKYIIICCSEMNELIMNMNDSSKTRHLHLHLNKLPNKNRPTVIWSRVQELCSLIHHQEPCLAAFTCLWKKNHFLSDDHGPSVWDFFKQTTTHHIAPCLSCKPVALQREGVEKLISANTMGCLCVMQPDDVSYILARLLQAWVSPTCVTIYV